jgi:hypothetical protein
VAQDGEPPMFTQYPTDFLELRVAHFTAALLIPMQPFGVAGQVIAGKDCDWLRYTACTAVAIIFTSCRLETLPFAA